jgi:hypothetical protein
MKMVKSLLLGSAAGLVAVAGAQAADLPVKAKPVEYVKVCSLYGAGFFYIPGTDTCIKLGGYVRVEADYNSGSSGIPVGLGSTSEAAQGAFTRDRTNDTNFITRAAISVDTRQQTEYGTLRSYFRIGVQERSPTDLSVAGGSAGSGNLDDVDPFWDRAFVQFAGFTVGRTVSFYDGLTWADFSYNNPRTTFDTGANGITLWAYTAQFGNGVSFSVSAEDPNGRFKSVTNFSSAFSATGAGITPGTQFSSFNGGAAQSIVSTGNDTTAVQNGFLFPDVVGALRVDQAWGSAQIMAAMHDASGAYYEAQTSGTTASPVAGLANVTSGHPDNAFGWAVGGAFVINLPTFGATANVNSQPNVDQLKFSTSYTNGALGYVTNSGGASLLVNGASSVGFANMFDGAYTSAGLGDSQVKLTTAWSAYGGYQHIWTPNWRTSLYAGYMDVTPDSSLQTAVCPTIAPSCLNWSLWQVGSRTQWNPVSQLDVGVDVLYSHLNSEFAGTDVTFANVPGKNGYAMTAADQDVWSVLFRVQRNFWP